MAPFESVFVSLGQPADLRRIVDFIEGACAATGVGPDACSDLQLAVEEACTNVMQHAYGGQGGPFTLWFATQAQDVVITVHDRGRPFDPQTVSKPDFNVPLNARPLGGLGMHLMQSLMDEVQFSFSAEEGNTLTMVKRGIVRPIVRD